MKVTYLAGAQKGLAKMPVKEAAALQDKVQRFAMTQDLTPKWVTKLVGMEAYRIRQGDWRAVCRVVTDALVVVVTKVGHRRDVYE